MKTKNAFPAALLLLSLVSACGPEDATQFRSRGFELTRVCGVDKYAGPQGVDVSTYQPGYDWAAQAAAGVRFGYARVSNGTMIIDDQFDRNWPEMKANGIYRGAYQYFRPGQDAVAQANLVVDRLGMLGPGDMPAMIDVETADGQPAATVASKVRQWLEIVEAGTGKKPTIYTGAYFWQDNVGDSSFGEYPLWIANYGADCPLVPDGWDTWTFWQYCDGNPMYCDNGQGFDRDVFNGTDAQLDEIANGLVYAAEVVDQSQPITLSPGETTSLFVEVRNSGSAPWDANTKLGTTAPRDRESAFADEAWPGANRAAVVAGAVEPGQTHRFEFNVRAPDAIGTHIEHFGLVQEAVTWFADGGGPADEAIAFTITVDAVTTGDGGGDSDAGVGVDSGSDGTPPTPKGSGFPDTVSPSPGIDGGCASAGRGAPARPSALVVLVLGAFWVTRRCKARFSA